MKYSRKPKGDGCFTICRADLIDILMRGAVLWTTKFGAMVKDPSDTGRDRHGRYVGCKELHPRSDTVKGLIDHVVIIESDDANDAQRSCGMRTYRFWAKVRIVRSVNDLYGQSQISLCVGTKSQVSAKRRISA